MVSIPPNKWYPYHLPSGINTIMSGIDTLTNKWNIWQIIVYQCLALPRKANLYLISDSFLERINSHCKSLLNSKDPSKVHEALPFSFSFTLNLVIDKKLWQLHSLKSGGFQQIASSPEDNQGNKSLKGTLLQSFYNYIMWSMHCLIF